MKMTSCCAAFAACVVALFLPVAAFADEAVVAASWFTPENIANAIAWLIATCSFLTAVVPADSKGNAVLKIVKGLLDALALNFRHAANGLPDSVQVDKP